MYLFRKQTSPQGFRRFESSRFRSRRNRARVLTMDEQTKEDMALAALNGYEALCLSNDEDQCAFLQACMCYVYPTKEAQDN
jgi:hypothetical protein